jgi:hypothetical protein
MMIRSRRIIDSPPGREPRPPSFITSLQSCQCSFTMQDARSLKIFSSSHGGCASFVGLSDRTVRNRQ